MSSILENTLAPNATKQNTRLTFLLKLWGLIMKILPYCTGDSINPKSNWCNAPGEFRHFCLRIRRIDVDKSVYGQIESFSESTGRVQFFCDNELDTTVFYSVQVQQSRSTILPCLRALQQIKEKNLLNFFTKFEENIPTKKKRNIKAPTKWFDNRVAGDPDQKSAVIKVLTESSYPFPLVITGGPGTGKTSVIIETIRQILEKKSFANVLVTCQSNSACDELAFRLRNFLPALKVFRYWGRKIAEKKLENKENDNYFTKLRENSSIVDRSFKDQWKETSKISKSLWQR
jgi:hypothetical protein